MPMEKPPELSLWEPPSGTGIRIAPARTDWPAMYLWFYEWNMFDALLEGLHPPTRDNQEFRAGGGGSRAAAGTFGAILSASAVDDGVELSLTVANLTDRDWPELASIVPCFNPGQNDDGNPVTGCFADDDHRHTYYYGTSGLERLDAREIHYQSAHHERIRNRRPADGYPWDEKWPEADRPATEPLLIREAEGEDWSTGVAWENSISSQGHNPWNCMHLSVKVGPLRTGECRTLDGKIYLLEGGPERIVDRFESDFG